eukprot:2800328-Ditylum_brightwellii.AAC.1
MTPQDYTLIPNITAYIQPPQPLLVLPHNGTQYQITQAKEQYYNKLHMFNEIVDSIGPKSLTVIRDPMTHQITLSLPDIIEHLFDNYGDVTAEELRDLQEQ